MLSFCPKELDAEWSQESTLTPRKKSPQAEEVQTHNAASCGNPSPTHYQLSYSGLNQSLRLTLCVCVHSEMHVVTEEMDRLAPLVIETARFVAAGDTTQASSLRLLVDDWVSTVSG